MFEKVSVSRPNRGAPQNDSSDRWEQRSKLSQKATVTLKFITVKVMPTAITSKLLNLGSCYFA